jgi:heme-degrading monooxygenase HmoA
MSCTEIAEIMVKPGSEADFENAVRAAVPLFQRAKGFVRINLDKVVERPATYRLVVVWETLENHTVDFRGSEEFQEWRQLAGPFFEAPPRVDHSYTVI